MSNFIEITLRHGCSPVNFLLIFITPFSKTPLGGCLYLSYFKKLSGIILPLEARDDDIQMSDIKIFLWFYMLKILKIPEQVISIATTTATYLAN